MHFKYAALVILLVQQSFVFGMAQEGTQPNQEKNVITVRAGQPVSPLSWSSIQKKLQKIKSNRIELPANQIKIDENQDQQNQ